MPPAFLLSPVKRRNRPCEVLLHISGKATNRALERVPFAIRPSLEVLGGWRRRNNIPGRRASESKCLKYLLRQFLLRGGKVFPKEGQRTRVTRVAEIYARYPMTRYSWTHYFCGMPVDGLVNDDINRFPFFFERVRVSAIVKPEHDAVTDKLSKIGINTI